MKSEDGSQEMVNKLKLLFIDDIDSVRTFEGIKTFHDLVLVLEDRDILTTLLGYSYNVGSLTVDDILNALEEPSDYHHNQNNPYDVPVVLTHNWRFLANILSLNADACLAENDSESTRNVLLAFKSGCGKVCDKEVEFRLLRAIRKCARPDLEVAIIEFFKGQKSC